MSDYSPFALVFLVTLVNQPVLGDHPALGNPSSLWVQVNQLVPGRLTWQWHHSVVWFVVSPCVILTSMPGAPTCPLSPFFPAEPWVNTCVKSGKDNHKNADTCISYLFFTEVRTFYRLCLTKLLWKTGDKDTLWALSPGWTKNELSFQHEYYHYY